MENTVNTELKAALERFRNHDYPSGIADVGAYAADRSDLAHAFVAEHPDDSDELVTHEWLSTLSCTQFGLSDVRWSSPWSRDETQPVRITCVAPNRWIISHRRDYTAVRLHLRTRGDVRRLCLALNINLAET